MPIDHTSIIIPAALFKEVVDFYLEALKPLGYEKLMSFGEAVVGLGAGGKADWWLFADEQAPNKQMHTAFTAPDRKTVDAFHAAAIAAGAKDNGKPGPRVHYHPNYYGAFVIDPAGNNIEAVCHLPE